MDDHLDRQRPTSDDDASFAGLLARLIVPLVALTIATAVLFGASLPSGSERNAAATSSAATPNASAVAAEPAGSPTPASTPFVLRTPPTIYTTTTPVPGSAAAQAALTRPCIELATGHYPSGDIIRDGIYQILAAHHPECP